MLEYLVHLPNDLLGQNILGFIELIDIIKFENAATSHKSQLLLREIIPYCPPIMFSDSLNQVILKHDAFDWFIKRICRIQFVGIDLELLCEMNFEHSISDNIKLCLKNHASLTKMKSLQNSCIKENVCHMEINGNQDLAVMEVLFSLLSSVRSLDIKESNLSEWMEHIKKIGPYLREISISDANPQLTMIKIIAEYCPYLEKLSLGYVIDVSDSNILQSIANICPHLHSLHIKFIKYNTSAEADADLTAFAEKCPQLEELSLNCHQLTDQSVIALAQHCSKLKKLNLIECDLSTTSLIALSEHGLPLEELEIIPRIPIISAEIAAQCAHALSRIRKLETNFYEDRSDHLHYTIQYRTGLRLLHLESSVDHLLVPHLLHLLQEQCCAGLESLYIGSKSSITPQQLSELVSTCPRLDIVYCIHYSCISDAVLVELARSCPHLKKVTLCFSAVTEEDMLAIAAHCRQLREINLPDNTLTEETVRQLAQHCRRLTKVYMIEYVKEGRLMERRYKQYSSKEIRALRETLRQRDRALRETVRQRDRESSNAEVITLRSSNTCCLIL